MAKSGKLPSFSQFLTSCCLTSRRRQRVHCLSGSVLLVCGVLLQSCAPDFAAIDASLTSEGVPEEVSATDSDNATAKPGSEPEKGTVNVGLVHSLSGPLAISEAPLVEAELLAIEEINANGGVLGKQIIPLKEDASSDWPTFAEKAEKLINEQDATVLFGGMTSASRKALLPVVRVNDVLLWYPGAYEGQECDAHVFYTGVTANQQLAPAVSWMVGNRGKEFFLVSSGDRVTHDIVKAQVRDYDGKVAGEAYVPLVNGVRPDMAPVIEEIKQALPEGGVIFNALVGNHNRAFFKALRGAGLSYEKYLVMSVRVAEEESYQIGANLTNEHYAAWPYFQSIESEQNQDFVSRFQAKYGSDRLVGAPMEAAYSAVHLWAQSVEAAQSFDTKAVRTAAYGQTYDAPSGPITIQPNHHMVRTARIGKALDNGQFTILSTGENPIEPTPWSQALNASKGFSCDWSDPEKGGRYLMQEDSGAEETGT
ncbi:MAG: urea ABC transporter substrate-binding protein [Phormidesmis sp.]